MKDTTLDVTAKRDDPTRLFDESLVLLVSVQAALAGVLRGLETGNAEAVAAFEPKYAELEIALKRAFEMERMVNDWNRKQRGGATARDTADIDFDRARHEIGCRLARLRACCQPD